MEMRNRTSHRYDDSGRVISSPPKIINSRVSCSARFLRALLLRWTPASLALPASVWSGGAVPALRALLAVRDCAAHCDAVRLTQLGGDFGRRASFAECRVNGDHSI